MSDFRVVVGSDGSPSAPDAVGQAADETARREVPPRVAHLCVRGRYGPSGRESPGPVTAAFERAVRRRPGVKLPAGAEVPAGVVLGDPAAAPIAPNGKAGIPAINPRTGRPRRPGRTASPRS